MSHRGRPQSSEADREPSGRVGKRHLFRRFGRTDKQSRCRDSKTIGTYPLKEVMRTGREPECVGRVVWVAYCRLLAEAFARLLKSSANLTQWSRSALVLTASTSMWT